MKKKKVVYQAKLKGKLDMDGEHIFIGDTEIRSILLDHYVLNEFEVTVKVYEKEEK